MPNNQIKKILLIGSCGYIGSELAKYLQQENYNYTTVDNLTTSYEGLIKPDFVMDYQNLEAEFLDQFDVVVWLAGHSSVTQSVSDPVGCVHNNFIGLIELNEKFSGLLIYASSGSVYSSPNYQYSDENAKIAEPHNVYDFTKISFDNYMELQGKNYIGLRFGTVVGSSPNVRWELLLNKMVSDSLKIGRLNLANPHAARPVLHLKDLCGAILKMINGGPVNQFYNLCNINGSMEYFANEVSKHFSSEINHLNPSSTYNFMMSTKKFEKDYDFQFNKSIQAILDDIKSAVK